MKKNKCAVRRTGRRLGCESLGARSLMAADVLFECGETLHYDATGNPQLGPDYNFDNLVTIADLQIGVGDLRRFGVGPFLYMQTARGTFSDGNNDGILSFADLLVPLDALREQHQLGHIGPIHYNPLVGAEMGCEPQVATLQAEELSFGLSDTVVRNQRDVTVGAFEAYSTGEDLLLTGVSYVAIEGSLVNAMHWRLLADTDNNGEVDTIVDEAVPQNGVLRFDEIDFVIDEITRFEVHMDIASSPATDTIRVGLSGLSAETIATGESVEWGIGHADQPLFHIEDNGVLEVRTDTTPVREHQVLLGELSDVLLRAELRAGYEDAEVIYIGIDAVRDAGSLNTLLVYVEGLADPIASVNRFSARPDDTFGAQLNHRQLIVPKGQVLNIRFAGRPDSDNNGGMSGEAFALAVDAVMARGDFSSNNIDVEFPDGPIEGPEHITTGSKPDRFADANPDQDGSPVPTGTYPIAQHAVGTARNRNTQWGLNDAVGKKFTYYVNATNVELDPSSFRFYNKEDATIVEADYWLERSDDTPMSAIGRITGEFRVVFPNLLDSSVNTEIDSGTTEVFVLQANILNASVGGSTNACRDAIDNDGDGKVDLQDPGCSGPDDTTEWDVSGSFLQVSLSLEDNDFIWVDSDALTEVIFEEVDHLDKRIPSTLYRS